MTWPGRQRHPPTSRQRPRHRDSADPRALEEFAVCAHHQPTAGLGRLSPTSWPSRATPRRGFEGTSKPTKVQKRAWAPTPHPHRIKFQISPGGTGVPLLRRCRGRVGRPSPSSPRRLVWRGGPSWPGWCFGVAGSRPAAGFGRGLTVIAIAVGWRTGRRGVETSLARRRAATAVAAPSRGWPVPWRASLCFEW